MAHAAIHFVFEKIKLLSSSLIEVYTAQLKCAFCWMKVITLNSCAFSASVLLSLNTLGASF